MLVLRILISLGLACLVLPLLAWRFQDRLAFPAPRASLPDPKRVGVENGEKVELVSGDGTKLVGWYLKAVEGGGGRSKAGHDDGASTAFHRPPPTSPALLWFYGNGETVAAIWPIVREFQPPGTALPPPPVARQPHHGQAGPLSDPAVSRRRRSARAGGDGHGRGGCRARTGRGSPASRIGPQ